MGLLRLPEDTPAPVGGTPSIGQPGAARMFLIDSTAPASGRCRTATMSPSGRAWWRCPPGDNTTRRRWHSTEGVKAEHRAQTRRPRLSVVAGAKRSCWVDRVEGLH